MVIAFACLGSFTAGIAVGMLIVYLYWCRIERELNETIEKTLNKIIPSYLKTSLSMSNYK